MSWKLIARAEQRLAQEIALLRPPHGGDLRIALGYPNTYHVGMSNLGLQVVYGILNQTPGVSCERFFLPDPDELEEYERHGRHLFTLESQQPLEQFDLIALSCSYENDYCNVLRILELAGLPLLSCDRTEQHPLVLVGGAITLLNPEPLADFVDIFGVGEAEGLVEELVVHMRRLRDLPRPEQLMGLAQVPGLYVPSLYTPNYEGERFVGLQPLPGAPATIAKNYISRDQFEEINSSSWILSEDTEFGKTFLMEVSRGCPYICRFCTVGFSYPKVRWKPLERLWEDIATVKQHQPRVGLISATVGNHPEIEALCERLMQEDLSVSFSSLRADKLPDAILETLVRGGSKSMTLAPETGSEELRKSINKRFSDEQYFEAAERAFRKGIKNLKMYSMVGLPNELDEDMDALVKLVEATRRIQVSSGRGGGRITLGLGLFVPKPLTPYQWNPMVTLKLAEKRMQRVSAKLARVGGVKVNPEVPKTAILEGLQARADRRLGRVLLKVYHKPSYKNWQRALAEEGISLDYELYRQRDPDEVLPWSHIASSWPKERLLRDSERARQQRFKETVPL
ncbi:radical SAM protein [bacterium]|nr:radical SAM protein [bacterium]